jgi:hypothetical protein
LVTFKLQRVGFYVSDGHTELEAGKSPNLFKKNYVIDEATVEQAICNFLEVVKIKVAVLKVRQVQYRPIKFRKGNTC